MNKLANDFKFGIKVFIYFIIPNTSDLSLLDIWIFW